MGRPSHISAAALGNVTPKCDEARRQPGSIGANRAALNSLNSQSVNEGLQAADELGAREFSDLQRRFEAAGFALHPLHDETLIACRWGMTRTLVGVAAARRFLNMVAEGQ
ncbi:hypothetical protein [Roseateles sp. P5_E4]